MIASNKSDCDPVINFLYPENFHSWIKTFKVYLLIVSSILCIWEKIWDCLRLFSHLLGNIFKEMWLPVDLWAGLYQLEVPHPLPYPWNVGSASVACFQRLPQRHSLEMVMWRWDHLDSHMTEPSSSFHKTFRMQWAGYGNLLIL